MTDADEERARRALRALARTSDATDDATERRSHEPQSAGERSEWQWGPEREPGGDPGADAPPVPDADADYRAVIATADAATEDLEAAARFVERVGLDELERAVERAERSVSGCAAEGRAALSAFEAFRGAAGGPDHFHRGRGTSLGGDD